MAPFIVINDRDAKSARAFTLVHELAHIYLGQSGVSGTPESVSEGTTLGQVERFCNDVAGEVLLPSTAFATRPANLTSDDKESASRLIKSIAEAWSVSESMVAYRIYRLKWTSRATYLGLTKDYAERWKSVKTNERAKAKESERGPSYYTVKQHKLGDALIDAVRRTLRDSLLSHTKAARVLGVKTGSVEPLLRRFEGNREMRPRELRG